MRHNNEDHKWVSLTQIKSKENYGKFKTEDKEINLVRLNVPDPNTTAVVPSAIVTLGKSKWKKIRE